MVYFIEEGVTRSVFHHDGQDTTTWFSQEGDVTFGMDSLYYISSFRVVSYLHIHQQCLKSFFGNRINLPDFVNDVVLWRGAFYSFTN